ncbi:MAG: 2-phospho-L-lactate transferase [Acidobacteria bacterium]|nr:2-phospho-L-lactate transferase [Acidobacteriota bacterium]
MITVLAGGVGAAKFLEGLAAIVPQEEITVIVNTGDDAIFHGLHVSPDIDTIIYTLAGLNDRERGWGLLDETYSCLQELTALGEETWFTLGDRDFATHLYRARRLREGALLSEVTSELTQLRNLKLKILPMTDDPAPTVLDTSEGRLGFQQYFVGMGQRPVVDALDLSAAQQASPAKGVIPAITRADAVIIAPSNPLISIGPILAVREVREALVNTRAKVAAISPIIGGKALKGPADKMLTSLGYGSSASSVAKLYADFLDIFILDQQDESLVEEVAQASIDAYAINTIMNSAEARKQLAQAVLEALRVPLS